MSFVIDKPNFEVLYEKIRAKTKHINEIKKQLSILKKQNREHPDISFLQRGIWTLESEIEKLTAEYKGQIKTNKVVALCFDDVMDYIGILENRGEIFKIKLLMKTINVFNITPKQKELFKLRKMYIEQKFKVEL